LHIFERFFIITVSIVNDVQAGQPGKWVLIAGGDRFFFVQCTSQCGTHPASCPVCIKGSFHGIKQPGHEDDYSELFRCGSTYPLSIVFSCWTQGHTHFLSPCTIFECPL